MFALPLDERVQRLGSPFDKCFESGCSHDVQVTSTAHWAYALVLPAGASPNSTLIAPPGFEFHRRGAPGAQPFAGVAGGSRTVAITAQAREVRSWRVDPSYPNSPQPVPASPLQCEATEGCGPVQTIELVPYGSTRLRVGMLPYTLTQPVA